MAAESEARVGSHRLVFEAEDIIVCHFGPALIEREIQAIVDLQAEHVKGQPYFLVLDFTRIGTLPEPVRRAIGQSMKKVRLRGIAMYGGSFHLKAMARLINTALAIFAKNPFPQEFFGNREGALIWIHELRKQQAVANT